MVNFATVTVGEIAARKVLGSYNPNRPLTTAETIVINVFCAAWERSLKVSDINAIGHALYGQAIGPTAVTETCNAMVKAKVLRRATSKGVVYFEINY